MRNDFQVRPPELKQGQLWKLKRHYIYIVELGNRLIQFKLMDSAQDTGARTLTSGLDTLWRYVRSRGGRLVSTAHP